MQDNLENKKHDDGIRQAYPRGDLARRNLDESRLKHVREHSACAQTEKGDGDGEKREVIEQNNREESSQGKFEQERGETREGQRRK